MAETLRILIAEDHLTVRAGLKLIVDAEKDMKVVGETDNGREAIELAKQLQPDIVLMDISMPELNGLVATAKLKRVLPEIKILTLTRHTDDAYLRELMEAGASGYILKQSAAGELIRAIRTVAGGNFYLDPSLTEKVFRDFSGKNGKLRGDLSGERLTARESETLRYVALGYSNREIAEKLDVSVKTVEAHKANALKKLNMTSRKDIVGYAIMQGWMREN
jgi:two-component system, NarL family, response regulator NreC